MSNSHLKSNQSLQTGVLPNNMKTDKITHPIFILQKRAIRIIHKTTYREPTKTLFIKLRTLKCQDLIDYKTSQIMFNANNHHDSWHTGVVSIERMQVKRNLHI